jgi:hypothetical protein
MERYVTPLRLGAAPAPAGRAARPRSWRLALALSAAGATLGFGAAWTTGSPPAPLAAMGAAIAAHAYFLYCAYTTPAPAAGERRPAETERPQ